MEELVCDPESQGPELPHTKEAMTEMGLMCEQIQNKPVVTGRLARSSTEACSPPLGACRDDGLKRSWLTQTLWVIFRG